MRNFCSSNANWAAYVDITSGIHNEKGFLKYPDDSGIHLVSPGTAIFIQNIQTQVGRVISGVANQPSEVIPGSEDDDGKITLQSSSDYSWNDGSNSTKTISCNNKTYLSEINSWLKNSPDVWWCSPSKIIKEYFDNEECGMTFSPCTKSGSNPTDGEITDNDSVPYDEPINGDRCYNGEWVKVITCQKSSIANARCKLSDGKLVLRQGGGLTEGYGCSDLPDAYSNTIDDYRCNKASGNWIYIVSCQPSELIGAKCKTSDSTIIRTYLSDGNGCSGVKPSNRLEDDSNKSDESTKEVKEEKKEISGNPLTGTVEFIICMIIGFVALIFSGYYYRKNKY